MGSARRFTLYPKAMTLTTYADLSAYLQTLAAAHASINSFCEGDIDQLQQHMGKSTTRPEHVVLMLEWPDVLYRDTDGAADKRWRYGLFVGKMVPNQNHEKAKAAISACQKILEDVLIRIRSDAHDDVQDMRLTDSGTMEPARLRTIDNLFGYRIELFLTDWLNLTPDPTVWTDL